MREGEKKKEGSKDEGREKEEGDGKGGKMRENRNKILYSNEI